MVAACNPGEADCAGHAVCDPRDPATRAVAVGDDRCDRKSRHRVNGVKAAGVKRVVSSSKEAVRIRAVARVFQRLLPARNTFESQIERETIRESFRRKKRSGLRVGILFDETDRIDRRWNGGDKCSGIRSAKDAIKATEAVRSPEVWSAVRVGSDECRRYTHDSDGRKPVLGFRQTSWKEPNLLLICGEIPWESAERDLAIRCSRRWSRTRLLHGRGGGPRVRGLLGKRRSYRS